MVHTHGEPIGNLDLIMTREQRRIVTVRSHAENHQIDYRFRPQFIHQLALIVARDIVQQRIIRGIGGGANGSIIAVGLIHHIGDVIG